MSETVTHYVKITTKHPESTKDVVADIENRLASFVEYAAPIPRSSPEPVTAELESVQAAPGIYVTVNVFRGEPGESA